MTSRQDKGLSTDDFAGAAARTETEPTDNFAGSAGRTSAEPADTVAGSGAREQTGTAGVAAADRPGAEPAGDGPRPEVRDGGAQRSAGRASSASPAEQHLALFPPEQAEVFRNQWADLQAQFVDDPEQAVRGSDALVAEVMQTLAASFARHKSELEGQWTAGDMHTEGLRQAFHRYRAFFQGLLSA